MYKTTCILNNALEKLYKFFIISGIRYMYTTFNFLNNKGIRNYYILNFQTMTKTRLTRWEWFYVKFYDRSPSLNDKQSATFNFVRQI